MQNDIKTESEPQVCCDDWLARTCVATIFIVAGAGNMAFAAHYSLAQETGNFLLALAGGICGCWAGIACICAR